MKNCRIHVSYANTHLPSTSRRILRVRRHVLYTRRCILRVRRLQDSGHLPSTDEHEGQ